MLHIHKGALWWNVTYIKIMDHFICMHQIALEDDIKPTKQIQYRLNPTMMVLDKVEVLELLDACIMYPITKNKLVSSTQMSQKQRVTMI